MNFINISNLCKRSLAMKFKSSFYFGILCSLVFLIFSNNIIAQVSESWARRYNGPGNGTDKANAIAVDSHGNVYVTGSSQSAGLGTEDYLTIKYDAGGVQKWMHRYNGSGSSVDIPYAIAIDTSGSVIVTGGSVGSGTDYDYLTIKYSPAGDTLWTRRYNGPKNAKDIAYSIALDDSGNIFITGESEGTIGTHGIFEDYATVKYNPDGVFQWAARYNGPAGDYDRANYISVDKNSNVYVTGMSDGGSSGSGSPYFDYATIKYNSAGFTQWIKRYNGPGSSDDEALMIKTDTLGNIFVTGNSVGIGSSKDYATICYSSKGDTNWISRYNGTGNDNDMVSSLTCDNLGNAFITGVSYGGSSNNYDFATIKYNSLGDSVWVKRYNGDSNDIDGGSAIALDRSGNVYVTGYSTNFTTGSDYTTIKYSPDGIEKWTIKYTNSDAAGSSEDPFGLFVDTLFNVYVTGMSALDYATVKYVQTPTSVGSSLIQTPNEFSLSQNYPNPFNPSTIIKFQIPKAGLVTLKVYDILGKEIVALINENKMAGYYEISFNASQLASGIYIYQLKANDFISSKKMILMK
jgi:Secretion system C-terminal sorting domain/Beta-propeller repeat